eukprot:s4370_g5.t1
MQVGEGVVGYKIRGTTVAGPKCKLLFCTTGVILRRLANEGTKFMFSPKTVTHLLVDEVHERGVETDFMLTFLKEVRSVRPNLRVVLMSATMDTECFLKYFSLPAQVASVGEMVKPPMVVCPAFCHPVAECYLDAINTRLGRNRSPEAKGPDALRREPAEMSESDGIDYDLILKIVEEIETSPDGAWTFAPESMRSIPKDPRKGAILVFLPGLGEITQLMSKLADDSKMASKWWVLPLHANLPPEEQQACFNVTLPAGCTRKIICSTNVAETSVTVPDVTVVIDTCRERRNQVDRHSNTPMLREQWCALDSMKQRRGRAGRVQPGVCLRLLPERYLERMESISPPEMQRVPLENVYLQVCASGISDRPGFLAKTPDPPDKFSAALRDLGALDAQQPDGLTPLGRHLAALPCHPRLGKILVLGCLLGVPGPCLSICAAMSVRNPMMTTQDTTKRAGWQMEMVGEIGTRSDHCAWAHIVQEWRFGDMKQRELCRKLGLSFERMCSSMFERKHLMESLMQVGLLPSTFKDDEYTTKNKMPDWNLVKAAVVGGLFPNIIHAQRQRSGRYYSNNFGDKAKLPIYQMMQRTSGTDTVGYPKSVNLHPNSLMFGHDQFHCPWLAFYTIQQTTKLYAYDVSEASPFALLLFCSEPGPVFQEFTHTMQVPLIGSAGHQGTMAASVAARLKAAMIELQGSPQTSLVENGESSPVASSRNSMAGPTVLACACCFLIYMLQMVGLAKIPPHMYDASTCAVVPWLREQMLLRFYFTISEVAYLPSFAWALVEMLRSAAVDLRMQTKRWSTYTALMSSLFLLCFFQLMNRILLDTMGKDYVNGKNNNDPVAILGMVMESFLSFLMQCRLFAYADHIMGGNSGNSGSWKPPAAARACVLLSASFLGLRSYHVGVLLLGHKPNFWLSTSARFGRIFFRFLMGGAHAVRAKAYSGHALSDTLSSQMRCNMATLSEMMLVSAVLAASVDLVVVVKGLIAPEIFSADFTEPEHSCWR